MKQFPSVKAILIIFISLLLSYEERALAVGWWDVQSVDTMKQSRDLAREKINDKAFEEEIDRQVKGIADLGATHVAIATPYDEEFVPFLNKWVKSARDHNLKVWFRGNFSGWEGWFGYSKIGREEHKQKTKNFLDKNKNLFESGDIFTPCPECENGGPGDPRSNGDVDGHRKFILDEYSITKKFFKDSGKEVASNYASMNYDVASLIMDPKTTFQMDGLVTIDHYVSTSEKMGSDIIKLRETSKGDVFLGEMGAPIPDIHGQMDKDAQAKWVAGALKKLSEISYIRGVNYWVNIGGTTGLWDDISTPRPVISEVERHFKPRILKSRVINKLGEPIANAKVSAGVKEIETDQNGWFEMPIVDAKKLSVSHSDYEVTQYFVESLKQDGYLMLEKRHESLMFKLRLLVKSLFSKLK